MSDNKFHNPYHFVPLGETSPGAVSFDEFAKGNPSQVTHDRYVANMYSGRLICRLTTVTPAVVGGKQTDDSPKKIEPAQIKIEGKDWPLIPASSLRGMFSSLMEAASNSALRVLGNQPYSYRRSFHGSISAMGLVVKREDKFFLRPLSLPHCCSNSPRFEFENLWQRIFPQPLLKVYFGDVANSSAPSDIRNAGFLQQYHSPENSTKGPFYYLKLAQGDQPAKWSKQWGVLEDNGKEQWLRIKNGQFLLGQRSASQNAMPVPETKATAEQKCQWTRGIVRVLGVTKERQNNIPTNSKHHEIFLPYTEEMQRHWDTGSWTQFELTQKVIGRFEELAFERREDNNDLPYAWKAGNRDPQSPPKLEDGDIVFFWPDDQGNIAEITPSSIWRGRVESEIDGSGFYSFDFFAHHPDLLPTSEKSPEQKLTMAELMLGFVGSKDQDQGALASRVRFQHAFPLSPDGVLLETTTPDTDGGFIPLKILGSPKPPSPAFYFKPKTATGHIAKDRLNPAIHEPLGRKFYLHQQGLPTDATDAACQHWRMNAVNAADPKLKNMQVLARPIKAGQSFWFHVDFDNLSREELGLLCVALRPSEAFRHKLGHGKPLGLGTVQIDPSALLLINRHQRYACDRLDANRYYAIWLADAKKLEFQPVNWPERYAREKTEVEQMQSLKTIAAPESAKDSFPVLRDEAAARFKNELPQVWAALECVGDPARIQHPVHYPQMATDKQGNSIKPGEADFERELFQWFMFNERGDDSHAALRETLQAKPGEIPPLTRHEKTQRQSASGRFNRDPRRR